MNNPNVPEPPPPPSKRLVCYDAPTFNSIKLILSVVLAAIPLSLLVAFSVISMFNYFKEWFPFILISCVMGSVVFLILAGIYIERCRNEK